MNFFSEKTVDPSALNAVFADRTVLLSACATRGMVQREHHSRGESYHPPALPDIVCYPHTTVEVSEIVKISARYHLPVIPFGAGTSLEGQVNEKVR
ncbi:MAG: FAD-binding protein [Candidatus Sulfotelmatobacter sp.]